MQSSVETSKSDIEKYAIEILGKDFKFREGQLDAVKFTVDNAVAGLKHSLLEAPTGSGKSMIALIAAYVLHRAYDKKTYILVSDLSLFKQYENDIKNLNSPAFGCIKGKDNYTCWKNGCKASQSECSLQNVSVAALRKNPRLFPCKHRCKYIKDYIAAVEAPVTLMTYQMYFIQRNYVEDALFDGNNKNFPERDLVICDECHKICEICQSHFAPVVTIDRPEWMDVLDSYLGHSSYEDARMNAVNSILNADNSNDLLEGICKYKNYVSIYANDNITVRNSLADKTSKLTKAERRTLSAGNRARQEHCKLEDLVMFVSTDGCPEHIVKTIADRSITLNFVLDDVMLKKYMHNKSGCEMLMSATIGDFNAYAKIAGLDKKSCKAFVMSSTFDFSKSPIMFSSMNKMSYDEKDKSIVEISKQATDICRAMQHERGIVQTGSYANTMTLINSLPVDVSSRCLTYVDAKTKAQALADFISRNEDPDDNSILVGPTLIEGLNFPDKMCRFQICIKVPYACLGSEYVRKKMQAVDGWYEYDVLNKLCQSIGRGIRHKTDWCKTYILDGCITNLIRKLSKISVLQGRFVKM